MELIGGFVNGSDVAGLQAKMVEFGPAVDAFSAVSADRPRPADRRRLCSAAVAAGELDDLEVFGIIADFAGGRGRVDDEPAGGRVASLPKPPTYRLASGPTPSLIPAFVEEVCRIEPPFRGHYRRVVADTTLGGVALPAGSRLVLAWPAANRAPSSRRRTRHRTVRTPASTSASAGVCIFASVRRWPGWKHA